MAILTISLAALAVAALTLFSGFGLGTLLLPAFALFMPLDLAIAATAVVHLANNIFKLALMGKKADLDVVTRFAPPAAIAAVGGALLLIKLSEAPVLLTWELGTRTCEVTPVGLCIAVLILGFTAFDLAGKSLPVGPRALPIGGALSGFFGGLSGHQGALRTAFLSRVDMTKEAFVGTMVVAAVVVDVARLLVYGVGYFSDHFTTMNEMGGHGLILAGTLSAFVGSFIGVRLLGKVTLDAIHRLVAVLLVVFALGLGAGLL